MQLIPPAAARCSCPVATTGNRLLRCSVWPGNHSCRTVKAWDVRAMGCESSKRGQSCLASLEIRGAGVWAIDWMQQEDGNWLGAVAGMC